MSVVTSQLPSPALIAKPPHCDARSNAAPPPLPKQGAHALFTTGVSVILGLVLGMLVSRTLGPAGKGVLDVTGTTTGLFVLVLGGSINSALIHLVARDGAVPRGIILQLAAWAVVAGGAVTIALAIRPQPAVRLGLLPAENVGFWIVVIVVSSGFGILAAGLRALLIGRHALILANRIDLGIKAALVAAYAVLAMLAVKEPKLFGWVGAAAAIALAVVLFAVRPRESAPIRGTWPALLSMALPIHATNLIHFLNQRADVFFVQAFHGSAEVGIYALAVGLAQCVLLISSALAQPLLPQISAATSPEIAAGATAQTCRRFVALGIMAAMPLAVGAPWMLPLLFGREFAASLTPLLVLLPGMFGFGLANILISHFVGVGNSQLNVWISVATLVVTLGGNAWLTRIHGGAGAAATSTLAYFVAGGISVWCFAGRTRLPLRQVIIPAAGDWRFAIALLRQFRL